MAEQWDAFLDYPRLATPRESHRKGCADPLPATLGKAARAHLYLVAWCLRCKAMLCVPLAPLIIRWGPDAAPDALARAFRCARCGGRGMGIAEPTWRGGFRRDIPRENQWTGKQDWHPALGAFSIDDMCNLYSNTRRRAEITGLFGVSDNRAYGFEPMPAIFPKSVAPIVRVAEDGEREMVPATWGFPLLKQGYAPKPVTNVRDDTVLTSRFWRPSFEVRRCLVPASSYCEPDSNTPAGWHWFALDPGALQMPTPSAHPRADERPLFAFPGIWKRYKGPLKKDGEPVEVDVYAFMTTKPNALTATIMHDRMPVLLSEPEHWDTWLTGTPEEAYGLVRTYPADAMRIVQSGKEKRDLLGVGADAN